MLRARTLRFLCESLSIAWFPFPCSEKVLPPCFCYFYCWKRAKHGSAKVPSVCQHIFPLLTRFPHSAVHTFFSFLHFHLFQQWRDHRLHRHFQSQGFEG